jgi:hypothetical protein
VCLRGASAIEQKVLARITNPNLRVYVVWLPILASGAFEPAARREGRRIPDPRVARYAEADARLAKLYSPVLHLPQGMPAWDVYLVFAPAVRWPESPDGIPGDDRPPAPTYWMHQLAGAAPAELRLDGDQIAHVVNGLLWMLDKQSKTQKSAQQWARPLLPPRLPATMN